MAEKDKAQLKLFISSNILGIGLFCFTNATDVPVVQLFFPTAALLRRMVANSARAGAGSRFD